MTGPEYRVTRHPVYPDMDLIRWRRNDQAVWVEVAVVDHDDYRAASDAMANHRDHQGGGL